MTKARAFFVEFGSYNHSHDFVLVATDLADHVGFIRMHTDRHVATIGTKNQYRMQVRLCYSVSEMNFGAEFQPKKNTLFPCRVSPLFYSIQRLVLRGMRLMIGAYT
jgi:hypothetical protein